MKDENIKLLKDQAKELTMLYVEDDEQLRNYLLRIFSTFLKVVDTAENGQVGFKMYKDFKKRTGSYYDFIVTDLNMPSMGGKEMSKKIREIRKEQVVLVISASTDVEDLFELINTRINYFVRKPIIIDELIEVLFKISRGINDEKLLDFYYANIESLTNELNERNKQLEINEILHKNEIEQLQKNKILQSEVESETGISVKKIHNTLKNDLRFTQYDKMNALLFVETLDDTVIDKIESFIQELDRLNIEIYDLEANLNDGTGSLSNIVEIFNMFTSIVDTLIIFPVTVRAFISFSEFLRTIELDFHGDEFKKKLFISTLIGTANDLEGWINSIFIDKVAEDIHYFDSSFANNCLEMEAMFSGNEIESNDDDLEFF